MKVAIFNGSPRIEGNTSALVNKITNFIKESDVELTTTTLFDKKLSGCSNCGACQKNDFSSICTLKDDMEDIYKTVLDSDFIILASPVYMWQITPCTLAFLNRLHALHSANRNDLAGKGMALAMTLGDASECGDAPMLGLINFCEYFGMKYSGTIRIPFAKRNEILAGKYDESIESFVDKII